MAWQHDGGTKTHVGGLLWVLNVLSSSQVCLHLTSERQDRDLTAVLHFAVVTCEDSSKALACLRDDSNHFDLVLSDVVMPGAHETRRSTLQILHGQRSLPVECAL